MSGFSAQNPIDPVEKCLLLYYSENVRIFGPYLHFSSKIVVSVTDFRQTEKVVQRDYSHMLRFYFPQRYIRWKSEKLNGDSAPMYRRLRQVEDHLSTNGSIST